MLFKEFIFVLVLHLVLKLSVCSRRIVNGIYTSFEKRYMVYFVKSNLTMHKTQAPSIGDYWLCGGAIVSPTQIITSAACLHENNNIYAIAGYRKYVKSTDLDEDECTKRWKQRVVKICTPKDYVFEYSKPVQWLSMDVGIAIVEKPYDFSDLTYRLHCTYTPAPVKILYEEEYQLEGIDVQMLGWGHVKARQPHNLRDLNSLYLREASGKIQPKSHCRGSFHTLLKEELIDKYLICVHHAGNIGGDGELLTVGEINNAGCTSRRNMDPKDPRCNNNTFQYDEDYFDFRRNGNQTAGIDAKRQQNISIDETNGKLMNTRRQGICQNDHGGPLITWVGKEEVMIGIALTSLLSDTYECIGPYLFTSAFCASTIIQCLLVTDTALRTKCEDKTKEKGFSIHDKSIDWGDVKSDRKPAEADLKPRQIDPLQSQTTVQNVQQQPYYVPLQHQPYYVPWQQQSIVYSQPQDQRHPQVLHPQPQLNVQKSLQHSSYNPAVKSPSKRNQEPRVPVQEPVINSRPQLNLYGQQNIPKHPQYNTLSKSHVPLRQKPQQQALRDNIDLTRLAEYAKIRNVGF